MGTWIGNLYKKFEDMCIEMDEIVSQETLDSVENQLQTAVDNVSRFCIDLIQEVCIYSVEDINSDLIQEVLTDSVEDINSEALTNSVEDINSSAMKNPIHLSSEQNTPSLAAGGKKFDPVIWAQAIELQDSVILAQASKDELQDSVILALSSKKELQDSVILAQASKNGFLDALDTSVAAESGRKSITEVELKAVHPSDNVRLEESCVIVDHHELRSMGNNHPEFQSTGKKDKVRKRKSNSKSASVEKPKAEFSDSDWEVI